MGAATLDPTFDGFAAFYRDAYSCVSGALRRYFPGLAEEVAQDAFVIALEHWPMVAAMQSPGAWVWTVARRLAFRRAGRESERIERELRASVEVQTAGGVDVAERVDLDRALDELSDGHKAAAVLHHLCGLPLDDVADRLGLTPGAAKVAVHRARRRLGALSGGFTGTWIGERTWTTDEVVVAASSLGVSDHTGVIAELMRPRATRRRITFVVDRYVISNGDGEALDFGTFAVNRGTVVLDPEPVQGRVVLDAANDGERLTLRYRHHTTPAWFGVCDSVWTQLMYDFERFTWVAPV